MAALAPTTTATPNTSPESQELKYVGPEPKPFSFSLGQSLQVASAFMPAFTRLFSGVFAVGYSCRLLQEGEEDDGYSVGRIRGRKVKETSLVGTFPRPAQSLEMYEFEGCPFCRKVREGLSMLDLDAVYYPCPKGGATWRPKAIELGGKAQFPYLVDPNTGTAMYESDAILQYIFKQYGNGHVPLGLRLGMLTTLSAGLGMAARGVRGVRYVPSTLPEQPLVLWGFEGSPFVKLVKEVLSEMELPHLQVPAPRGSPRREELLRKRGHFQVPYLEDPNAGVCLFESAAIVAYLRSTYAA